jgi:type II secretory pathway pseudopilin PulG
MSNHNAQLNRKSSQYGVTLEEMLAIMLIVAIFAAGVIPRAIAYVKNSDYIEQRAAIQRIGDQARAEAVKDKAPIALKFSDNSLVLEKLTVDPTTGTFDSSSTGETVKGPIQIDSSIHFTRFQLNGQNSDVGSFQWIAYPDGSSDTGGIEVQIGSKYYNLILRDDGSSQWQSGELEDMSKESWQVGSLSERSSS